MTMEKRLHFSAVTLALVTAAALPLAAQQAGERSAISPDFGPAMAAIFAVDDRGDAPAVPSPSRGADGWSSRRDIDLGAIAATIVRRSARVQPGELVWISGGSEEVAFMERLAVAVGAEGGHPVVTVSSNEMLRRWYQEVPERFDGATSGSGSSTRRQTWRSSCRRPTTRPT
jgi:hypothetical protein